MLFPVSAGCLFLYLWEATLRIGQLKLCNGGAGCLEWETDEKTTCFMNFLCCVCVCCKRLVESLFVTRVRRVKHLWTGFVWFGRVDLSEVLIAFWSHNDFIRQMFIALKSKVGFFVGDSLLEVSYVCYIYYTFTYHRNRPIHVGKYTVRPMDPSWATLRTAKKIFSFWSQWSAKSDLFGTNLTILYNGRNPPNLRLVVYPIIYRVLAIADGAGFLTSTVSETNEQGI